MAIKRKFASQTILKPGAYSRVRVDNTGGAPLTANDTLFLLGEASDGAPGSTEGIQTFRSSQLAQLVDKYKSGPIVDAALAAVQPSKTPGIGGASRILVWKTNASEKARVSLHRSGGGGDNIIRVEASSYGESGNFLTVRVIDGTPATLHATRTIEIHEVGKPVEVLGTNPDEEIIKIVRRGSSSNDLHVVTTGDTQTEKMLTVSDDADLTSTSTNQETFELKNFTIKELIAAIENLSWIDTVSDFEITLETSTHANTPATELDPILIQKSVNATHFTLHLKRLQYEMVDLINTSEKVTASIIEGNVVDINLNANLELQGTSQLAEISSKLHSGTRGISTNSDFSTGLDESLSEDYNVVVPCISRDASDDSDDGLTLATSTYTISAVSAALDTHLRLRGNTKNRKEAQGVIGILKDNKAGLYTSATTLGSELVQMVIQEVRVVDEKGDLSWKQPHVMASIIAGMRLGSDIGEPLTHKYINVLGVRHTGDFNTSLDAEDAVEAGILFTEVYGGQNRVVVDNTTYGRDDSFIFNRGSVMEAAQYIAKTLRAVAEISFVGRKITNDAAPALKSILRARLIELNAPDVNIITSSDGAAKGFVEETFTIDIQGNTATVNLEVKPVQGLDFVLISLTLGDIQQSA